MPKPPVVWHLDSDEIDDFHYNPPDRLTRIKQVMKAFEESDGCNLQAALDEINAICKNKP